jgi:hypothetical protein
MRHDTHAVWAGSHESIQRLYLVTLIHLLTGGPTPRSICLHEIPEDAGRGGGRALIPIVVAVPGTIDWHDAQREQCRSHKKSHGPFSQWATLPELANEIRVIRRLLSWRKNRGANLWQTPPKGILILDQS